MGSCLQGTGTHKVAVLALVFLGILIILQIYSFLIRGTYVISTSGQTALSEDERAILISVSGSHGAASSNASSGSLASSSNARDAMLHIRRKAILEKWGFEELVNSQAASDNPKVVGLARELMDPPSTRELTIPRQLYATPQYKVIQDYFGSKQGFFVECGALDGERSSNTIVLENSYGWEGLLIEADSFMYTHVLGKNRKAWSINACLSPNKGISKMVFSPGLGTGHLLTEEKGNLMKWDRPEELLIVPCFTLDTLLLALNRTHVDYFSLDVEGVELEVLSSVDFRRFDITTLSVEYSHLHGGKKALSKLMDGMGYDVLKQVDTDGRTENFKGAHDVIFIRR